MPAMLMRAPTPLTGYRKCLLFLPFGIGDVVMQLPSLRELRRQAEALTIFAVGSYPAIEVLADGCLVADRERYDRWGIKHWWDDGDVETIEHFRAWCSERHFDCTLGRRCAPKALRAVVDELDLPTYDLDDPLYRRLLAEGCSGYRAFWEANRSGWGLQVSRPEPEQFLELQAVRLCEARAAVQQMIGPGHRYVVFCPSASLPMKRWPAERFAEVADHVIARHDTAVIISSGASDAYAEQVKLLAKQSSSICHAPTMHLLTTAALLRDADALLTNDTGLLHLAAAVPCPSIAIFGPTDPHVFAPPDHVVTLGGTQVDCPKHGRFFNGYPGCWGDAQCPVRTESCINEVGVEQVQAAVSTLLQKAR